MAAASGVTDQMASGPVRPPASITAAPAQSVQRISRDDSMRAPNRGNSRPARPGRAATPRAVFTGEPSEGGG